MVKTNLWVLLIIIISNIVCYKFIHTREFTNESKSEMIKLSLTKILNEKIEPFYSFLYGEDTIFVSDYLMSKQILPQSLELDFKLIDKDEINARAKKLGTFSVIAFYFDVINSQQTFVNIDLVRLSAEDTIISDVQRAKLSIEFKKYNSKWVLNRLIYPKIKYLR